MRSSNERLGHTALAASILILAATVSPYGSSGGDAPLTIQGVATHANVIAVTVANSTPETVRGTVILRVVTSDGDTVRSATVTVAGGGTESASIDAGAPVTAVEPLGVVLDDGVPF